MKALNSHLKLSGRFRDFWRLSVAITLNRGVLSLCFLSDGYENAKIWLKFEYISLSCYRLTENSYEPSNAANVILSAYEIGESFLLEKLGGK